MLRLTIIALLLAGCGLSPEQVQATIGALPTQTPAATETSTPVLPTQDPFTQCVASGEGVRYVVEGEGGTTIAVTASNDDGDFFQGFYSIPYCSSAFLGFKSGDFIQLTAEFHQASGLTASLSCKIYLGNQIIAENESVGIRGKAYCFEWIP